MEVPLPRFCRIGEIGIDIGAVEDVAGPALIYTAILRYDNSWQRLNGARLVVPNQPTLPERPTADPAAPTFEILKHSRWLKSHLLTETFGYDRDLDEGKEVM